MRVNLENGKIYQPKPDDPVVCEEHGVKVKWKDLTAIGKIAVSEGLDIDGRCILLSESKRKK